MKMPVYLKENECYKRFAIVLDSVLDQYMKYLSPLLNDNLMSLRNEEKFFSLSI